MAKKQLDHKYKLINSTPNDSIEKIEVNFIMLKEKLNDKHFYMPHVNTLSKFRKKNTY